MKLLAIAILILAQLIPVIGVIYFCIVGKTWLDALTQIVVFLAWITGGCVIGSVVGWAERRTK